MGKIRNKHSVEYKRKGKPCSESVYRTVTEGTRSPKVDVTPYLKLNLRIPDLAERVADCLLYLKRLPRT